MLINIFQQLISSSDDPSSGKIDFDYYTMQAGKPLIKTVKAEDADINYIVYTAQKTDNSTGRSRYIVTVKVILQQR